MSLLRDLFGRALDAFGRGGMWYLLLLSLLLVLILSALNPVLLASYAWAAAKLLLAGCIGLLLDVAAFPGANPRYMDPGLERSMAQSRRGVVVAAAMIAAGLIG